MGNPDVVGRRAADSRPYSPPRGSLEAAGGMARPGVRALRGAVHGRPEVPGAPSQRGSAEREAGTVRQPPNSLCRKSLHAGKNSYKGPGPARAGRNPQVFTQTRRGQLPHMAKLGRTAKFSPKRFFLLDRARPVFFLARPKRKWGVQMPSHHHGRIPPKKPWQTWSANS